MKVGYLAPSVDGQAQAIAEALAVAGVGADSIGYVEAHGTGTPVGDPIEVAALTQAFRQSTDKVGFCGIGSVKTQHRPPRHRRRRRQPHQGRRWRCSTGAAAVAALRGAQSGLRVRDEPVLRQRDAAAVGARMARRAAPGVSSLGVGGTNAHVVLEEAPAAQPSGPSREQQLLLLSAKTESALDAATAALADHLARSAAGEPRRRRLHAAGRPPADATAPRNRRARLRRCRVGAAFGRRQAAHHAARRCRMRRPSRSCSQAAARSTPIWVPTCTDRSRCSAPPSTSASPCSAELTSTDLKALLMPAAGDERAAAQALERPSLALPALFIDPVRAGEAVDVVGRRADGDDRPQHGRVHRRCTWPACSACVTRSRSSTCAAACSSACPRAAC